MLQGGSSSPNANGATPSTSSNGKQAQSENTSPQGPPNPFFGTRVIKKAPPVHVKDDFNPFKHHKVIEAAQVGACCSFSCPFSAPASLPQRVEYVKRVN